MTKHLLPNGDPDLSQGIGGDPSQGQYATPAQGYGGSEPPPSTTGKSAYEHYHFTDKSTDPRDPDKTRKGK